MQTNLVKNCFEKSFDKYDENAFVQKILAENLSEQIFAVKNSFDTVFEIGCGTGLLTRCINNKITFKKYFANDLTEKSKNYIAKILPEFTFIHGNAQKIKPPHNIDLLTANAVFQWFNNLDKFINYYKPYLNKNAILAFSTFGKDNFSEIQNITGLGLNYLSQQEIINILKPDFDILYTNEYKYKLDFNTPLELLAHMKNTGVNSLKKKIWSFKNVKDFCTDYMEKYENITLTYNPIIITAKFK